MTTQCPRCGSPRLGEAPFCHNCGLDFRATGAPEMPPQQTLPASQSVYGAPPPPGFNQSAGYQPQPGYYYPQAWQYGQPAVPPPSAQAPAPWGATPQYQPQYQMPQPAAPQMPPAAWAPPAEPYSTGAQASAQPSAPTADDGVGFAVAPATLVQAAPTVCLRCYSQLPAGYTRCANCGFENSSVFAASTLAPARIPMMAVALALLGAGLLITAAALVYVAQAAG